MNAEELSWEEKNHLYKLCTIPTLIVFYAILIYLVYLMRTSPFKTVWEGLFHIGPLLTVMPTTFFITFEVLYHRKVKKPLGFHMKRFAGRMLLLAVSVLSYFGFLIYLIKPIFSPIVGDRDFLVGSVLWVIIFSMIIKRFRGICF